MNIYLNSLLSSFNNSDVFPATESNAALAEFLSHKLGMFISYGMTSFMSSDGYVINYDDDPPPASNFAAPSTVDSAQWAIEAKNAGCDYAVLTTGHHVGFNIFPYTAPYNGGQQETTYDSTRGQLTVPLHQSYDVSDVPSADQNIVGKFVAECANQGLKCGLYYNVGKNINIRRGLDLIDASYDQTDTFSKTYKHAVEYTINELEWILTNYAPDYLWLDANHHFPRFYRNNRHERRYYQDLYNACKAIRPETLIIINYDCAETPGRNVVSTGLDETRPPFTFDGKEMLIFPSDIISFEYFRVPSSGEFNPVTTHKGTDYYIPREIISTILEGQYFARNDTFNDLETLEAIQSKYNTAQARGVPLLLNVAVATDGVIPEDQLERFNELVL